MTADDETVVGVVVVAGELYVLMLEDVMTVVVVLGVVEAEDE